MRKTSLIYPAIALLVGMVLLAPPVGRADSNTFTVCATGCDYATIQAALDDDRVVAGSVIQVQDAVHTEANIVVHKDVTIQGQSPRDTIVQAHDELAKAPNRVFLVPAGVTATLRGMTIRHGKPRVKGDDGGGVMNYGTLTVENCVVADNAASGGGGMCSRDAGVLTVVNCAVRDNLADGTAPRGLECGNGGGILCGGGTLELVGSTVSGNQAGLRGRVSRGRGGGVFVGCNCTATLTNSTISGNQSLHQGGGIGLWGTLRLVNCTISHNTTSDLGGGIYIRGPLDWVNTIIARNDGRNGDCFLAPGDSGGVGSIGTNSHNLVGDGTCEAAYSGDPLLGPLSVNALADNGGPVQTHALLPGSPAIDAVPADECLLTTDQRGLPRPVVCTSPDTPGDLGAFEVQADECAPSAPGPTPVSEATPSSSVTPPASTVTPRPATPVPGPPAAPGDLLPGLGFLGLLLLGLVGLVALWLWRRRA